MRWLLVFLLVGIVHAQEWKYFDTSTSAVPSNLVYTLVTAPDSSVWIGTASGVARYRSGLWSVFHTGNSPIPSNTVTAMAADRSGNIWIGTASSGITRYAQGEWTTFTPANSGLPAYSLFDICAGDSGSVWAATDSGVARFRNGTWISYADKMIEPRSRSVAVDKKGTVWVGTYDPNDFHGFMEYFSGDSSWFTDLPDVNLISTYARDILPLNDSVTYVATGTGLAKVTNGTWDVLTKQNSPLPANGVSSLAVRNGTLLAGTASGVAEIDGSSWNVRLPSVNGLPNDIIYAVAVDFRDNTWLGLGSSGIALYRTGGVLSSPASYHPPERFTVIQNFPNPFNPATTIRFTLPEKNFVTVRIFDILGREVRTFIRSDLEPGEHSVPFDAEGLSGGIYFCQLIADGRHMTTRMILQR